LFKTRQLNRSPLAILEDEVNLVREEDKVKKGKLNPDRYKVAGGAPLDTGAETREEKRITQRQGEATLRGRRTVRRTKAVDSRRGAVGGTRQVSQKTGKRSGAQKAQSGRYGTKAVPAAQPVEGAFGKEPASEEYDEIP
jgi:transposase InsO family protein